MTRLEVMVLIGEYAGCIEDMEMATGPEYQEECNKALFKLMAAIDDVAGNGYD